MQKKYYIPAKTTFAVVCGDRFVVGNRDKPVIAAEQYFLEFFSPQM